MTVSIIIITYNSETTISECLDLLLDASREAHVDELIIVDNASSDGTTSKIESHQISSLIKTNLIWLESNIGFGPANNLAANSASADTLLFLNPDLMIDDRYSLRALLDRKASMPNSIIGPRLLNGDLTYQVGDAGFEDSIARVYAFSLGLHRILKIKAPYLSPKNTNREAVEVDWVCGACLIIEKELFDQLDGFDPTIFLYSEDVDLCLRAKDYGARTTYIPNIMMRHLQGVSTNRDRVSTTWIDSRIDLYQRRRSSNKNPKIFIIGLALGFICRAISYYLLYVLTFNREMLKKSRRMSVYFAHIIKRL